MSKLQLQGRYSPGEQKIFRLLRETPQTSTALCKRFYAPDEPAFYGRQIIVGLISSLAKKAIKNRERITIIKTPRNGPLPISFWIKRAGKK